jgi:hypothetical protein
VSHLIGLVVALVVGAAAWPLLAYVAAVFRLVATVLGGAS